MKLNLNPISAIADTADKIISRFKASPEEKAKAQLDQYKAETERIEATKDERLSEHEERMQRLKIEQSVAQSKTAAKIRPAIGKAAVIGIYAYIAPYIAYTGLTIIAVVLEFFGVKHLNTELLDKLLHIEFPSGYISGLVTVVLGQGTMRTVEKWRNVEGNRG